jgi:hypothetical protein
MKIGILVLAAYISLRNIGSPSMKVWNKQAGLSYYETCLLSWCLNRKFKEQLSSVKGFLIIQSVSSYPAP